MPKQLAKYYNGNFYDARTDDASRSARVVLERLFEVYQPQSVVDFGCGQGSWLCTAEALGSHVLKGYDGPWVKEEHLLSENIDFTATDLEHLEAADERFDLAISLEVAEHLSDGAASSFVDTLCRASDVVLFGAAIKLQGGTHHVNEQWQSYWIDRFRDNKYECLDIFRGALWNNPEVDWWYRQNTLLFVNSTSSELKIDTNKLKSMEQMIADAVHPENYERKARPIRTAWHQVRQYVAGKNAVDRPIGGANHT